MRVSRKKVKDKWVYFTIDHVDRSAFAEAVNALYPSVKAQPINVEHMYSEIERGRYGIGRIFYKKREPGTDAISVIMPIPWRKTK